MRDGVKLARLSYEDGERWQVTYYGVDCGSIQLRRRFEAPTWYAWGIFGRTGPLRTRREAVDILLASRQEWLPDPAKLSPARPCSLRQEIIERASEKLAQWYSLSVKPLVALDALDALESICIYADLNGEGWLRRGEAQALVRSYTDAQRRRLLDAIDRVASCS